MKYQTIFVYVAVTLIVMLLMVQVDAKKKKEKKSKHEVHRHVEKIGSHDNVNGKKHRKSRKHADETANGAPNNTAVTETSADGVDQHLSNQQMNSEHNHKKNKDKRNSQHKKRVGGDGQHKRGKHNRKSDKRRQQRREERKNKKILCDEQTSCDAGMCCVMINGTESCRDLTITHIKQCYHDCQCTVGLHCMKKNEKHHSKRAGRCMPTENVDAVVREQTTPMTQG